jgi:hypothetical protein
MADTHVALKDANSVASAIFESSTTPNLILRGQIDQITGRVLVDVVGGGGNTFVYNEVVSGSGTSWTLANTPIVGMQAIYANGQRLTPTVDYTISGANITTVDSWSAGTVLADYQH